MLFTSAFTVLAAWLSLTSASPVPEADAAAPKLYKLKTRLHNTAVNPRFNNLYVQSYHTGAGFNDVALVAQEKSGTVGFLNGTYQQFYLEGAPKKFPYGMYLDTQTEYTTWQAAQINSGYGNPKSYSVFSISPSKGLVQKYEFYGWRVCDWWHNVPQLFWKGPDAGADQVASCSDVDLIPVYQ